MKNLRIKLFGIAIMGIVSKVLFDTHMIKLEKIEIETNKLSDKAMLRIVQISDVHNKNSFNAKKRLIEKVKELDPDLVVLTGDLIDRRTKVFQSTFTFVEGLLSTGIPAFFVTGNHEWNNLKKGEFIEGLKQRGVTILSNRNKKIRHKQDFIQFVGVDDAATEHEDVEKAFSGIRRDYYTILLSHSPYIINRYPCMLADLVLSGHTHGGQIRLPFFGAVVSPGVGFFPVLDKGLYEWGNRRKLYVDSGLGTTKIPVRFLNQSQISLITITGTRRI